MRYKLSNNSVIDDHPHIIILESANTEKLLKHQKLAVLTDEVTEWLNENVDDTKWDWSYSCVIAFNDKEDAMGFLLRWA